MRVPGLNLPLCPAIAETLVATLLLLYCSVLPSTAAVRRHHGRVLRLEGSAELPRVCRKLL
jgi:hypothetical protein